MPDTYRSDNIDWSAQLRSGSVRWARTSRRYEETVEFYRDLIRLPVLEEFSSSYGEDGTIFGLPDTSVHMEIVRGHADDGDPSPFDQLVLYLNDAAAVETARAPLRAAGLTPTPDQHPYWQANGAITYHDPDGRAVVFAPWVYGRVPGPVDRAVGDGANVLDLGLHIACYDGDRQPLRALFAEAEDSPRQLESYIDAGRLLVAYLNGQVVGHLQLVQTDMDHRIELKSMAVDAALRGTGIGTRLVEHAIAASRVSGYTEMTVATAAADIDNLRFYQRRGFRLDRVDRNAFGAETGYAEGVTIDGIRYRSIRSSRASGSRSSVPTAPATRIAACICLRCSQQCGHSSRCRSSRSRSPVAKASSK
jgi:GNAT superfamily N-acetyltransferase